MNLKKQDQERIPSLEEPGDEGPLPWETDEEGKYLNDPTGVPGFVDIPQEKKTPDCDSCQDEGVGVLPVEDEEGGFYCPKCGAWYEESAEAATFAEEVVQGPGEEASSGAGVDLMEDLVDPTPPPRVVPNTYSPRREPENKTEPAMLPRSETRTVPSPRTTSASYETLVATVGVDPLEWLAQLNAIGDELYQARLAVAQQRAQLSRLESEYGSIGNLPSVWDHQRKALLAELAEAHRVTLERQIQMEITASGGKVVTKITESGLDTFAHSHHKYKQFVDRAAGERKEYEEGRAKLDELWAAVHHLEGKKSYLEQRVRLNEELIRWNRSIASLGQG